jgi:N-acetylglucosaminyl-diphospho-decaprenol L-rhamnosyltransferase
MQPIPDLSILIVSWNVRDYLRACLDSIQQTAPANLHYEIIVVDSASSDDTVAMLTRDYPQVLCLAQSENVGFTKGNNIALRASRGGYLFLLNPDTELLPGALTTLIEHLAADPGLGIVGPHTLNSDSSHQSTRRRFPNLLTGIFESTWLERLAPKGLLNHYYGRDLSDDGISEVDWVQGSALLARRAVYDQLGGLDEGFGMYSEELDWCKRAKGQGWRVAYVGTAKIVHHGGKSSDQAVASRHIYFQASKLRYFGKHHGPAAAFFLRMVLLTLYAYQLLLEAAKGLLGHKRQMRQQRVQVYWQVLRSLAQVGGRP